MIDSLIDFNFSILTFFNSKENEGALYKDGKARPQARMVPPNTMHTYDWFVPKRAAPGPNDSPCNTYTYYSAVDTIKDTNSGLIGPLITCRKVNDAGFLK